MREARVCFASFYAFFLFSISSLRREGRFFSSVILRWCIFRLRIGDTYTNSVYYTTSLSMSINVNKHMCRTFEGDVFYGRHRLQATFTATTLLRRV